MLMSAGRHPNLVEFYGAVIEDHEFPVRPPWRRRGKRCGPGSYGTGERCASNLYGAGCALTAPKRRGRRSFSRSLSTGPTSRCSLGGALGGRS